MNRLGYWTAILTSVVTLEYRYECMIILINWLTLIVVGILLSKVFKGARSLSE